MNLDRYSSDSPPPFVMRDQILWSIQANHSETRCSQLPPLSTSNQVSATSNRWFTTVTSRTKNKTVPCGNDPCRAISAPASYAYNYHDGNFTNGKGCTWTPYYFRYLESSSRENKRSLSQPTRSDVPLKIFHRDCDELKPTQSWVWDYCPQPPQRRRKETCVHLMRSPYLNRCCKEPHSSHKLQSSQKCEAWMKSNSYCWSYLIITVYHNDYYPHS